MLKENKFLCSVKYMNCSKMNIPIVIPIEFQNDRYEFKIFFCFSIFKFSA